MWTEMPGWARVLETETEAEMEGSTQMCEFSEVVSIGLGDKLTICLMKETDEI